jgi:hypothetical protein
VGPAKQIIKKDGEWTYKITPNIKNPETNLPIERINAQNQKEYWFNEPWRGKETTIALDGAKTVNTWFTSDSMSGKARTSKTEKNDKLMKEQIFSYDEKGNLIRKLDRDILWEYKYKDSELVAYRKGSGEWQNIEKIINGMRK